MTILRPAGYGGQANPKIKFSTKSGFERVNSWLYLKEDFDILLEMDSAA